MGVAGSGKTTIGSMLAERLGCAFLDSDLLHSKESVESMSRGVALTDEARAPWLAAIRERIADAANRGESLVVACSALKQKYRDVLAADVPITWIYLSGPEELIRERLEHRTNHFAKTGLLSTQLEVLEEPGDAIVVDISKAPATIVEELRIILA